MKKLTTIFGLLVMMVIVTSFTTPDTGSRGSKGVAITSDTGSRGSKGVSFTSDTGSRGSKGVSIIKDRGSMLPVVF
jgi:hypothetical protein